MKPRKDITVVYFRGYRTPASRGPASIKEHAIATYFSMYSLGDIPVLPAIAEQYLIQKISAGPSARDTTIVFCGTSLGGYWASRMAEYFRRPALLINPCTNPAESLGKYTDPAVSPLELQEYAPLSPAPITPRIVLLAKDDTVLHYYNTQSVFADIADTRIYTTGGHQFNRLDVITNAITELADDSNYLIDEHD